MGGYGMTRNEEINKEAHRVSCNGDEFSSFILGAEWADETMIDKACEWLKEKNKMCMYELEMILGRNFIEDFKKEMEK